MKANVGSADKVIRIVLGVLIIDRYCSAVNSVHEFLPAVFHYRG